MSGVSFINIFGKATENYNKSEEVHKLFAALMLIPDEVVKNITYVFINGEERKMKDHDAVMPLGVKGECVTFGAHETEHPIEKIRYLFSSIDEAERIKCI